MVSVIISVYNAASYIEKCISSILKQTYSDLEVIAVDDGSTDNSLEICNELAKTDQRIVVVHKENGGNASARNAGIDVAKGDFIGFVDADDYIESDMYETMLREMDDPNVTIVNCGIIYTDITGNTRILASERRYFSREEALYNFFSREGSVSATACTKLYRRSLFEKGLRFNNSVIHEDTEAMPRFLDKAEGVMVVNQAFYHYIKRSDSASTSKYFSIRGYHILDSMKEYEEMCVNKYPRLLPCFRYYELVTTYEMYLNLRSCVDYRKYLGVELTLRASIIKNIIKCLKWKELNERYSNEMKEMAVKAILGMHIIGLINK